MIPMTCEPMEGVLVVVVGLHLIERYTWGGDLMQEHRSKSSSASQPAHQARIQWKERGTTLSLFSNFENVLNVVRLVEPKAMHLHRL
jgi:hypothetical protein